MQTVERGELFLSKLLRTGVLLSAAVIVIGVVMLFATQNRTGYLHDGLHGLITYPPQQGSAPVDHSLNDVLRGLGVGDPDAVISLGLLLLIATPIVRVAASVFLFIAQNDRRYVAITLFVLTVLLLSFWLGKAE